MGNLIVLLLSVFLLSMACGFALIPRVIDFCKEHNLYDMPNGRKVHKDAIPRLGGICFLPCMFVTFVFGTLALSLMTGESRITIGFWSVMFVLSISLIYVTGIIDDIVGIGATAKLAVQIAAAALLPLSGLYINDLYGLFGLHSIPFWAGAPLTVFAIVFINNAMNLIDGIDGLCAGLAVLSLTGFMLCFIRDGVSNYAILIAGLLGILCSYLYFNLRGDVRKGHKIFMGDSGSLTIGFVLAFLFVKFSMHNPNVMPYRDNALLVSCTLLTVPCFDVVRVSAFRLLKGRPLFRADKSHIHHLLMRCGLTQRQALAAILALWAFFVCLNALLAGAVSFTWTIAADILAFSAFTAAVYACIRRKSRAESAQ